MKKNYLTWNKDHVEDAIIFEHLRILSDGKIDMKADELKLREANQLVRKNNSQKNNNNKKRNNYNNNNKNTNYRKKRS